jgi:hypothetical protein
MSTPRICLAASTLAYPRGAGHLWVFLNWALGLRALGCDVVWLEVVEPGISPRTARRRAAHLEDQLSRFGLERRVVLVNEEAASRRGRFAFDDAEDCDLLLNLRYRLPAATMRRFRRTALVDIDPGLTQFWMKRGWLDVPPHDAYFTTGEGVATSDRIPDVGIAWRPTRPCVALEQWPASPVDPHAKFTTVTHWDDREEWIELDGRPVANSKRAGFLRYLRLPRLIGEPIELATQLGDDATERRRLTALGWKVVDAFEVAGTPEDYRSYIGSSVAEFSCTKPAYRMLGSSWISDRTVCYLASGRAAVVQHTGDSRELPDNDGLFRFRDRDEAAVALQKVRADPEGQGLAGRALAEELFDATKVVGDLLTRAL